MILNSDLNITWDLGEAVDLVNCIFKQSTIQKNLLKAFFNKK